MIEDIVTELKSLLAADLPATLDTIDGEKGDGIVLDDIPSDRIYISERMTIQTFPAILIVADNSVPSSLVSGGTNIYDFIHSIIVACVVTDTNEEQLTKRIFRYVDAIKRVIEQNYTLNSKAIDAQGKEHWYSPMYANKNQYLKDFRLRVEVLERVTT